MKAYNPYNNPEKLGFEMLCFRETFPDSRFNILCFWTDGNGRVFTMSDIGESTPEPFEEYEGYNQEDIIPLLEEVGSVEQAERIFSSWNKGTIEEKQKLVDWVKTKLTLKENLLTKKVIHKQEPNNINNILSAPIITEMPVFPHIPSINFTSINLSSSFIYYPKYFNDSDNF